MRSHSGTLESIYDKDTGLQTEVSENFGKKVRKAIEGIIKEYADEGYSFRELSHEAQAVVRDIELDHVIDFSIKGETR